VKRRTAGLAIVSLIVICGAWVVYARRAFYSRYEMAADLRHVGSAVLDYMQDTGTRPAMLEDLVAAGAFCSDGQGGVRIGARGVVSEQRLRAMVLTIPPDPTSYGVLDGRVVNLVTHELPLLISSETAMASYQTAINEDLALRWYALVTGSSWPAK
jgi:hypothetical protein